MIHSMVQCYSLCSTLGSNDDVIWSWWPFEVPKGSSRLLNVTARVAGADGTAQHHPFQLLFAKSKVDRGTGNISNPTSVHGIYPYRGKISPKDVISVLSKLSSNKLLLDPFCGTGTILYEAIRVGNNVIGVDPNPLANIITRGKMDLKKLDREKRTISRAFS